jgi:hypothetical protein
MSLKNSDIPFFKHQRQFEQEYDRREKENFTSLKSELWWFVRNCSGDNFNEPLERTDQLTDELLEIVKKWLE